MKRYAIDTIGSYRGSPRMVEEDAGDYVRYDDHAARERELVEALRPFAEQHRASLWALGEERYLLQVDYGRNKRAHDLLTRYGYLPCADSEGEG